MPPYYFILHFWMKIFGQGDVAIRFLSVFFGVLAIITAYFIGKEILSKNKAAGNKLGLITAIFTSINSLAIYYSQEVKFYSLLTLLSSLSILFLIRVKNNFDKKNLAGLIIVNLALLYTFPMSMVFVFVEVLVFFIYLVLNNKNHLKLFIFAQLITLFFYFPYLQMFIPKREPLPEDLSILSGGQSLVFPAFCLFCRIGFLLS